MTTEEPVKAKSFVVVVDADLEYIINVMLGAILKTDGTAFLRHLKGKGLQKRYMDFLKEFAIKVHEHDMCRDPNCSHDLTTLNKPEAEIDDDPIMGRSQSGYSNPNIGEGYIEDGMLVLDFGEPKRRVRFNKADLKQFLLGLGEVYKAL